MMIELTRFDIDMEPRLKQHCSPMKEAVVKRRNSHDKHGNRYAYFVKGTDARGNACPFLGPDCLCTIYSTRPLICREWVPSIIVCKTSSLEERGMDTIGMIRNARNKGMPMASIAAAFLADQWG